MRQYGAGTRMRSVRRALVCGVLVLAGILWSGPVLRAQGAARVPTSVDELVAAGNRELAARRAAAALALYEGALALEPERYEALWRTAATLVDVAEFEGNAVRRKAMFSRADSLARRATRVNPANPEGHFQLSRTLGRVALSAPVRERTKYALDIREAAMRALALEPNHAGALHVLGRWHAEIMRLNGVMRAIAKTFMGGKVFGEASWREAVRLLEAACTAEPGRTVHLLALGQVYRDAGDKPAARRSLEAAIAAPLFDANDEAYKREAERDLAALR
jgi:regulator of microtubule dynamics protein 3